MVGLHIFFQGVGWVNCGLGRKAVIINVGRV